MTTAQHIQISPSVVGHQHNGRLTAGYKVVRNGQPVYAGTFSECAEWGSTNMERGANWTVRDARGLVL